MKNRKLYEAIEGIVVTTNFLRRHAHDLEEQQTEEEIDCVLNAYKLEFLQLKRYVKRAKKALLR